MSRYWIWVEGIQSFTNKYAISCPIFYRLSLLRLRKIPFSPSLLKFFFIINGKSILSNVRFYINWYDHIAFLLWPVNMVDCTDWFLNIEFICVCFKFLSVVFYNGQCKDLKNPSLDLFLCIWSLLYFYITEMNTWKLP